MQQQKVLKKMTGDDGQTGLLMLPAHACFTCPLHYNQVFSLWMNTMNRCISRASDGLASQIRLALGSLLVMGLLLVISTSTSFAQTSATTEAAEKALQELLQREALARQTSAVPQIGVRQFPAKAMRGYMEVLTPPEVIVNGTPERLSPGHRIRGLNNQLVMSGQLAGKKWVVNYVRNAQGELHEIWILNGLEELEERPGSGPLRNFRFESEAAEVKKLP